jgi:protease I
MHLGQGHDWAGRWAFLQKKPCEYLCPRSSCSVWITGKIEAALDQPGILFQKASEVSETIVGLICHAGLVGISAGMVQGRKATGSKGIKDDLINAGAMGVDEPAFRSGNIVWGRVVEDIPDFCRELVKAIEASEVFPQE